MAAGKEPKIRKHNSSVPERKHMLGLLQGSVNIHSPAARSLAAGSGGEAHSLCSPCCSVLTEGSAEADHGASAAASWR